MGPCLRAAKLVSLTKDEEKMLSLKTKRHIIFSLPPKPETIGAEYVMDKIRKEINKNRGHLRAIFYGLPGVGKSSAAIKIGHQFQSYFQKGVIWLRVLNKSFKEVEQELTEIFQSNLSEAQLKSKSKLFKSKDFLIIFDNIDDKKTIQDISNHFSHNSYIITTTFEPKVKNHFVVKINPFRENYIHEIFSRAVGRALTKKEKGLIKKISVQLGHLPLALTIVANTLQANLDAKSLSATLELLKRKKEGLSFFQENFAQIISAFELLFKHLSKNEKFVLKSIGLNPTPTFTIKDINVAGIDVLQLQWIVFTLNNKSLVKKTEDNSYTIHPVLYRFLKIKFG